MPDNINLDETLPVLNLCGSETGRGLIQFALHETQDDWFKPSDIADNIGVSYESFRRHVDMFMAVGILDRKSEDASIPHYRLAETRVTDLLKSWDGYPLNSLFETKGLQRLIEFFLVDADLDSSYSRSRIKRGAGMSYATVKDNINTLVEAGLLRKVDGKQGADYRVDADGELYTFLHELNNTIYKVYQK